MGLAIHKCYSISNSATAVQNMLHHNSNYTSHQILAVMNITSEHSTSHVIWFQDFSTYNKISFSHSCDHLPLNIFIPGTVHHLIYCLTVLVSRSYQWIPIDIFVQQVSRPGLTKGSIPGTLRFMTTAVSQLEKRQVSRCQTRRWHTLTTEEQTVPSKWYPLLARDTCVINRSGLQNLLGLSIICKQKSN